MNACSYFLSDREHFGENYRKIKLVLRRFMVDLWKTLLTMYRKYVEIWIGCEQIMNFKKYTTSKNEVKVNAYVLYVKIMCEKASQRK